MSFAATLVTGAADQYYYARSLAYDAAASAGTGGVDITTSIASLIRITNLGGVFNAGNASNILKYRIRYHTVQALT